MADNELVTDGEPPTFAESQQDEVATLTELALTNADTLTALTTQVAAQHIILRALLRDLVAGDRDLPARIMRLTAEDAARFPAEIGAAAAALLGADASGEALARARE